MFYADVSAIIAQYVILLRQIGTTNRRDCRSSDWLGEIADSVATRQRLSWACLLVVLEYLVCNLAIKYFVVIPEVGGYVKTLKRLFSQQRHFGEDGDNDDRAATALARFLR